MTTARANRIRRDLGEIRREPSEASESSTSTTIGVSSGG
jgi:hypothetical protein